LLLWHVLRIGLGYITATITAAVVFAASAGPWEGPLVGMSRDLQALLGETGGRLVVGLTQVMLSGFPTAGFVLAWAIAIAVGETWSLRALLAWLAAGGVAGLALFLPEGLAVAASSAEGATLIAALAAGFAAGFVYWLIAGRHAGAWRRALPPAG
jgi:hypothetical protein